MLPNVAEVIVFAVLPELDGLFSKCQWIGVIDDATHMNFAGNGPGADHVEPTVTGTIAAFLKGAPKGTCTPPPPIKTLQTK